MGYRKNNIIFRIGSLNLLQPFFFDSQTNMTKVLLLRFYGLTSKPIFRIVDINCKNSVK